ncbi:hypothetical protein [Flammeovirga kamogawensis]|uniref:Thiamine pyrophosphokinase n=1 Tax=Flammeovirga kamogawensis TaxID=373891 RepID=A0ABX8GV58_9BACT|nr:hypothetical protein [Flammeovirga kamogawensis]MBB6459648.1 thiamine pyrophosphokinase [Flammeovirga kamogawensis]QWG07289.1 hypothetical protein KM029_18595 [Flammeovirga kamogawensis]TRX69106.1 hypothetical protein EO216_13595 [Flammeovirga kamogawensis]
MSSHHIVRDDQEPAVLVLHIDESNIEFIQSLLEWSPIVIAVEETLEKLLSMDIKVDWVIVSESYFEKAKVLMQNQIPYKLKTLINEELNDAFEWLHEAGHKAVNVILKEFTHSQEVFFLEQEFLKNVVTFFESKRGVIAKQEKYEKWLRQGVKLSFVANSTKNLHHVNANTWEVKEDGMVTIIAKPPYFVFENLG